MLFFKLFKLDKNANLSEEELNIILDEIKNRAGEILRTFESDIKNKIQSNKTPNKYYNGIQTNNEHPL